MRKYLSTLHTRTDSHKKRFAFAVSGTLTLIMFTLWTLATFGTGGVLAQKEAEMVKKEVAREVSPFSSLKNGVAAGWAGFRETFNGLRGSVEGVLDSSKGSQEEYEKLRNEVLNTYGR